MRNQSGIALVMMLFVTAILALITINFIQQSNHQIKVAQRIQGKTIAISQIENAKAEIFYNLLTARTLKLEREGWNFYNEEFKLGNTQVKIQDLRGLFGLYGFVPESQFVKLLQNCKVENVDLSSVAKSVLSKHNGQSFPIDKLQRLNYLIGQQSLETTACLKNNITRHNIGNFNPSLAPKEALSAKLDDELMVNEFLEVRGKGRDNLNAVFDKYLDEDSLDSFSTLAGPYFRVILRAQVSESSWSEELEFKTSLSTPQNPIMNLSYQSGINE